LSTHDSPRATLHSSRPKTTAEMSTPPFMSEQIDTEASDASLPAISPSASNQRAAAAPQIRRFRLALINQRLLTSALLLWMGVFRGIGIRVATHRDASVTQSPPATIPEEYTIRRVSHGAGDYPSVAAALQDAPDRTAILICEDIWEEALQFTRGDSP